MQYFKLLTVLPVYRLTVPTYPPLSVRYLLQVVFFSLRIAALTHIHDMEDIDIDIDRDRDRDSIQTRCSRPYLTAQ
jgi:hypothetical protein